jgi:hypothetical protein
MKEAIAEYRTTLQLNPQSDAANNLAWLLATAPQDELRNGEEALRLARQLNQVNQRPEVLDTLAAAYAETGDFDAAAQTAETAIMRASLAKQTKLEQEIRARLELYQQHKPYRER